MPDNEEKKAVSGVGIGALRDWIRSHFARKEDFENLGLSVDADGYIVQTIEED